MIPHEYFTKVKNHFNNDQKKAMDWFQQANPYLGMFSPLSMLKLGRTNEVKTLIEKEMSTCL